MAFGTQTQEERFKTGKRLMECRKWRGLSREQLSEKVSQLVENESKAISVKQIGYIENGTRQLSAKYLLLLSKALYIRKEYLTLDDDYRTEIERIGAHAAVRNEKRDILRQLMQLHGFEVKDSTLDMPIQTDDNGRQYRTTTLSLISPSGSVRYFSVQEYYQLLDKMDDYIEYQCAVQFKRLLDGVKNRYTWEV